MGKKVFIKLAVTNITTNRKMYLPYLLTCTVIISLYYTINSLVTDETLKSISGGNFTIDVMKFGSLLFTVLSVFFLLYTNSFILKWRKKEFGLYHLLGLERKHIQRLLLLENNIIASLTITSGILIGLIFNKLAGLAMSAIMDVPLTVSTISLGACFKTIATFFVIFFILYLFNKKQLLSVPIIDLMKGAEAGEKEPKTRLIAAMLGGVLLIVGYILSFTVKDPKDDLYSMLLAIGFVTIATYLLFIAVSIALLKALRSKENLYYSKNNFTLISTMLYRMKQNAVGLSNITILSTGTLMVMTITLSLYMGINTILTNSFPYDIKISSSGESNTEQTKLKTFIEKSADAFKVKITSITSYQGGKFAADLTGDGKDDFVFILPLNDYNRLTNQQVSLADDEVLLLRNEKTAPLQSIHLADHQFKVKKLIEELPIDTSLSTNPENKWIYVIAPLNSRFTNQIGLPDSAESFQDIALQGDPDAVNKLSHAITDEAESIENIYVEAKSIYKESLLVRFGSLLFLGIFISTVLFAETALMIFYKQISEGYDDRTRFVIMKRVGMSDREMTKTIRQQTWIMFFAPLAVALLHLTMALPLVMKLIGIAAMDDWLVVIGCGLFAAIVFIIIYGFLFILTEKSYKKIIRQ
ncbi:FtsX-like permease family protein [Niallia sp. FSL M8-0099]|uniref:FtsX-like permease family protein n=1 Tax=Niallia sp. FSL M8-0099 TaxID=2954519 RepID=UPI0030FCB475